MEWVCRICSFISVALALGITLRHLSVWAFLFLFSAQKKAKPKGSWVFPFPLLPAVSDFMRHRHHQEKRISWWHRLLLFHHPSSCIKTQQLCGQENLSQNGLGLERTQNPPCSNTLPLDQVMIFIFFPLSNNYLSLCFFLCITSAHSKWIILFMKLKDSLVVVFL